MTETFEPDTAPSPTFADYGVRQDISDALAEKGITTPFPIQALTLPVALAGQDIIGQAKTGTGKTLGFGLPAIQSVVGRDDTAWGTLASPGSPQALIIVPTRELAIQVGDDLSLAAKKRNARVATLYGGRPYDTQVKELKAGVEVIVGTPGRLIDLQRQNYLDLSQVTIVVLDEADEMLDLGFLPDVEKLLSLLPEKRQTMLFSATMPGAVLTMARRYMNQPMHIRADDGAEETATKASIRQVIYRAHPMDKDELVGRILRAEGRGRTVIFTKTKRSAAKLSDELLRRGFAAAAIHGDLNQGAREQALAAFRKGKVDILVATDVAARGIDVEDVTHVINFQCPEDEKTYLHRVGRTGRAGNTGTAVTLVDWEDVPRWKLINKALELGVDEPVETYSSSPHLFADLDIEKGTKGRLPKEERTAAGLDAEESIDYGQGKGDSPRRSSRGATRSGEGRRRSSHSGQARGRRGASSSESSGEKRECGERRRRRTRRTGAEGAAPQAERTERTPREKSVEKTGNGTRRRRRRTPKAES
ncbi:MAG: DEAD/DEAH box helicase [Rothia sp. (in: high G+C Gram-positive bacteria)]|nr:DEAD/DEAH box helicase [Rothia sp. (in: high G+C Gram-positive bacteria)]